MDKRPKGRLPRLTDGFHLQDIGNAAKSAASLDKLRKFLESQKLIKCSHKAWVVRTQSLAPSGTKLGSPLHKAGVGSRTKRVPSGLLHLGGCIVLHGLTRSRLLYCGCPGVYFWDLWDVGTLRPKDYCAPTWRHCCLPPSGPLPSQFNTAH